MTSPNLSGLYEILEEEQACCAQLLEVSKQEQRSLVDNDLKTLDANTRKMQQAVEHLKNLHGERKRLLVQLGREFNMDFSDITFTGVIERLDEDTSKKLKDKLARLVRAGEALYRMNQQTIYLINFSMGLVDKQVELWSEVLTQGDGYDEQGTSKRSRKSRIIEGKV